ncbi:MAG: thiamine pyrophosphate-dependent enzyme [Tissierellia bacterium]|nr:thiamine pyrophosphate-dependent enzyme [Tissierellia bacterium]
MKIEYGVTKTTAWCPGCGNPSIRRALKMALDELQIPQDQVLLSAGIGQAGKMPQYIDVNAFAGLHGRNMPVAIGMKLANHHMKVIAVGGDGDGYGEGGNHMMAAIRRNIDVAHFVHNNQIYGLTKGQASPTTAHGQIANFSYSGVRNNPVKPLALALTLGAGFVARGFSGDINQLKEIFKAAIMYKGYALVDIMQPCIVWNKVNTFKWYKDRATPLPKDYDATNWDNAFKTAQIWGDEIPTGIIYNVPTESYTDQFSFLKDKKPLVDRELNPMDAKVLMDKMR